MFELHLIKTAVCALPLHTLLIFSIARDLRQKMGKALSCDQAFTYQTLYEKMHVLMLITRTSIPVCGSGLRDVLGPVPHKLTV